MLSLSRGHALATGFGLIGCLVHADFPSPEHLPELCFVLENVSWVISLALNGVSTMFLTWMAWCVFSPWCQ